MRSITGVCRLGLVLVFGAAIGSGCSGSSVTGGTGGSGALGGHGAGSGGVAGARGGGREHRVVPVKQAQTAPRATLGPLQVVARTSRLLATSPRQRSCPVKGASTTREFPARLCLICRRTARTPTKGRGPLAPATRAALLAAVSLKGAKGAASSGFHLRRSQVSHWPRFSKSVREAPGLPRNSSGIVRRRREATLPERLSTGERPEKGDRQFL
jgi:hypothetical protein